MSKSCQQCGAELIEGNAFCTKCGARREISSAPAAAQRFCTKCGATLAAETKFCTKCGATLEVPSVAAATTSRGGPANASAGSSSATGGAGPQSAAAGSAPVPSKGGIPKIALIGGGVIVLVLIVVVVAGMISAARRARGKAQEMQAAQNFAKSLANLASSGKSAAQSRNSPSAADVNKSINELANAANALTQNAQKQGGASPLDAIQRMAEAARGSSKSSASPLPGSPAAASAAAKHGQSPSKYAAIDALSKQLDDLQRDAPDQKTAAPVNALISELEQLTLADERNPNNPMTAEELKTLGNITAAAAKLTPAIVAATDAALTPPPVPSGPPIVPVAGRGNPKHDWPLEYERTVGGPEADLVVRTGDINNLGFGWPSGFDPFSGRSTPAHPFPDPYNIPPNAPPGTDRIMIGTGVTPVHMHLQRTPGKLDRIMVDSAIWTKPGDGYSGALQNCYALRPSVPPNQTLGPIQLSPNDEAFLWVSTQSAASCTRERQLTMPASIVLDVGNLPSKITSVVVQIFADDFQAPVYHSYFQVSLNGTRIPSFEYVINSLDQSGPIGKLVSMRLLPEYWPLLKSGTVKLLIDDPTTHVQDGYAVDFVRILVNPHKFKYQVSLTATVTDADKHTPVPGATVTAGLESAATDRQGKCQLKGIPAGLVVATASAPGYDENSVPVDLPAGQNGNADIQLHRHQESAAALEQSIAQTGTATIYGIHFDTGSSKLRADSIPALNAVLGLINGHPGSNWIIAGHTDNQGSDALNIPLSKARAGSVISWLTAHGVAANRLMPQGFGSTRPVADNSTANGRFLNRRVEIALAK